MADQDGGERASALHHPTVADAPLRQAPPTMLGAVAQSIGPRALQRKLLQRRAAARAVREASAELPVASPAAPPDPSPGGGSPLPEAVRGPMERSFQTDFSAVRVHQGEAAAAVGARAFTQGSDLHFAPGEYDPSSAAGRSLIGHELAHTVQQAEGRVAGPGGQGKDALIDDSPALEAEADELGDRAARGEVVRAAPGGTGSLAAGGALQRKVKGAAATLRQEGAKESGEDLSRKAKLKGLIGLKSTYAQILEDLEAYESIEDVFQAKLRISQLAHIRINIMTWLDKSGHEKDDPETEQRRVALQKTLNLLTAEWQTLQAERRGNTDEHEVSSQPLGKGAMNTVDLVEYDDGGKTAFKAEGDQNTSDAAKGMGISVDNPNFGNRNVAMYRLDMLLGTNVIPRTEFAVHGGYVGTVMDIAEGKSAKKVIEQEVTDPNVIAAIKEQLADLEGLKHSSELDPDNADKAEAYQGTKKHIEGKGYRVETDQQGGEKVFTGQTESRDFDYNSKEARQGMSNLQMVDALSGQLDRHVGNIYCETDKNGKVTGVKGIDNDLAFGKLHHDPNQLQGQFNKASHDVGIPLLIDKKVGNRILELTEKDIRGVLVDLLMESEIVATIDRFKILKDYVKKHKKELVEDWDDDIVKNKQARQDETQSYLRRDQEFVRAHLPDNA